MPLPAPRQGVGVQIKKREIGFSLWPMRRTSRRYGLHTIAFSDDPWRLLEHAVRTRCPAAARPAAQGFLSQAHDFYKAANLAGIAAAKPLLLYYCFLNLAKSYVLAIGQRQDLGSARHGLSEQLRPGGVELDDAFLRAFPTAGAGPHNMFDEFLRARRGTGLPGQLDLDLHHLLPQVVAGHRLWADASEKVERFVAVERIDLVQDKSAKELWLRIFLLEEDLARMGIGHGQLLTDARLTGWRQTRCDETASNGRAMVSYEQTAATSYTHRAADKVQDLVDSLRSHLWPVVLAVPPYRSYYLYPSPAAEHAAVLPPLVSIYAIMYYLGSITRYRPHHLEAILGGVYGPMIDGFISDQPRQFIYLLASDLRKQDVTKAAIV
jgi:hypothetical protein